MRRFTNVLNNKAYLSHCDCADGKYFQELINRLAEYEDLEEQGLIKRKECKTKEGEKNSFRQ